MSWKRMGAILVALAGCSESSFRESTHVTVDPAFVPPHLVRGGSRLQAVYLRTADGFEVFHELRDTVMDGPCDFLEEAPAPARCLPPFVPVQHWSHPGCQTPLLPRQPSCGHELVTIPDSILRVFRVGPTITLGDAYTRANGSCELRSFPPTTFATVLDEVRQDSWATRPPFTIERTDVRVSRATSTASDGTVITRGLVDNERAGAACQPVFTEGAFRCLPFVPAGFLWGYSDPECTRPVLSEGPPYDHKSPLLLMDSGQCSIEAETYQFPRPFALYMVVRRYVGEVFNRMGGVCKGGLTVGTENAVVAVEPASVDEYPGLEAIARPGTRLRQYWFRGSEGQETPGPEPWLRDTRLGLSCVFKATKSGFRCIPPPPKLEIFADAACTQRAGLRSLSDGPCATASTRFVTLQSGCPINWQVFELAAPVKTVYARAADHCFEVGLRPGTSAHRLGPSVALETFEAAMPVVR